MVAVTELITSSPILWGTLVIPFLSGLASLAIGRAASGKAHAAVNASAWTISLLLIAYAAIQLYTSGAQVLVDGTMAKIPGIGVFALFLDGVSAALALSIALVSAAIAAYSYRYMEHRFHEMGAEEQWGPYFFLYQLFTLGMLGVVYANNTILFYLFLELTLIPSFLLIVLYGYGDRVRIGLLYLVWTHVGAALYLIGALLVGYTAGFNYYIPGKGFITGIGDPIPYALVAFLLLVIGLSVKGALFGFHMWLPYAHAEAPTPISALLSPLLIGLGLYGLYRIVIAFFPKLWAIFAPLFIAWAFTTMIYGGLVAYTQTDVKRFLAYSSISQMGYLMLGLAVGNMAGMSGSMYHYVTHAFGKAILFGMAGLLIVAIGTRDITKMGGLASKLPYTAGLALLGFLHITGVPPTMGLWSEYLIARGLAEWSAARGAGVFATLFFLFMVAVAVSTVYSFVGFKRIFLSKPRSKLEVRIEPSSMLFALIVLGLAGILLFIFPTPVLDRLVTATTYIHVGGMGG